MKIKNKIFLLMFLIAASFVFIIGSADQLYLENFYYRSQQEKLYELAYKIKYGTIDLQFETNQEANIEIEMYDYDFLEFQVGNIEPDELEKIMDLKGNRDEFYYKISIEKTNEKEKLSIFTNLDGNNLLIISTPITSITEPLEIIRNFYLRLFLFFIFFALCVTWFTSGIMSKIILEIASVTRKISQLDFSQKITICPNDEIGQLSKDINNMASNLERTIMELESSNKSLAKEIEKEKNIDKKRREFISNVSHELKTPIAIISNYIEGLRDGIADEKETRDFYLEIIDDEAKSMNELVKKLLVLSKLENKNEELNIESINLFEIVRDILGKIEYSFTNKGMELNQELEEINIEADKEKMESVVTNFLSNASKYGIENGKVEVILKPKEDGFRFEVYNDCTVEIENLDELWEPFYRQDEARNRVEGTGLGLAIVKDILEKHNFEYGVEKVKNGILFWIEGGNR